MFLTEVTWGPLRGPGSINMKPVSFETNGVGIPGQTLLLGPRARTRRLVGTRFVSDPFYNVLVRTEKRRFFAIWLVEKGFQSHVVYPRYRVTIFAE